MRDITSRRLKEVKKWVKDVLKRDNYSCQKCGAINNLIAHHIIKWEDAPKLRVDINNGLTLCSACHQKHHVGGRKLSSEHIRKIVESRKWYKHSEETKEKQRTNAGRPKGIPMHQNTKDKLREANLGKKLTEDHKRKLSLFAGRPKGVRQSEAAKESLRLWRLGRKLIFDPETGKRKWLKQ